jgi:hypothetical protein
MNNVGDYSYNAASGVRPHTPNSITGICVENKNPYSPACHVSITLQVLVTGICVENKNQAGEYGFLFSTHIPVART